MDKTKSGKRRNHRAGSIPYYIEEVVSYRTKYEAADNLKDGYPPVVPELLLSILISLRAVRGLLAGLVGFSLGLLISSALRSFLGG